MTDIKPNEHRPSPELLVETVQITARCLDCIQVYLPKRLRHLSELYAFLRAAVNHDPAVPHLDGFTIMEGDGTFRGQQLYDERTLIIQVLVPHAMDRPELVHTGLIAELGREIKALAHEEEEVWITYCRQSVAIIRTA
jgi:hypothetical protein